MQAHGFGVRVARGHEQKLVGVLEGGRDAVVAVAYGRARDRMWSTVAPSRAPACKRRRSTGLFGDKNGLLSAVAEHGFAGYVAQKPPVDTGDDPIAGLFAGWNLHVGFGLADPPCSG